MKKAILIIGIMLAAMTIMTSCDKVDKVSDEQMSSEYETALDALSRYEYFHDESVLVYYTVKRIEVKATTNKDSSYTQTKNIKCGPGVYLLKNEYCMTHPLDDYALSTCGYEAYKAFSEKRWTNENGLCYYVDCIRYRKLSPEEQAMYIELYQPYD